MTFRETPVIVRIAGFPTEAVSFFTLPSCAREIGLFVQIEAELTAIRTEIVDRLYDVIHGAPDEVRRFLLAIKRDCFNGRSLAKHYLSPLWPVLSEAVPGLVERALELEERLGIWKDRFEVIFQQEVEDERSLLLKFLDDRDFMRGLALAAPVLVANLDRLRKPSRAYGRRERGLEQSLLRYVSRTAFKLSPFSTFSRVGLGVLPTARETGGIRLVGQPWRQVTLARIKKHVVNQYYTLLAHHSFFRRHLRIVLNDTVERNDAGRYRFLRNSQWIFDAVGQRLRYAQDSLVSVSLEGALLDSLLATLGAPDEVTYQQLIDVLAEEFDRDPGEVGEIIDKLLEIGILQFRALWLSNDLDPERRLLNYLQQLPEDETLRRFSQVLERVISLRDSYSAAERPEESIEEIDRAVAEGLRILGASFGLSEVKPALETTKNLNEDVFLLAAGGAPDQQSEVAWIPPEPAKRAIGSVQPLLRLANLFSRRYDFLHAVYAQLAERWPSGKDVPVLDAFECVQPLWRQYRKFLRDQPQEEPAATWNPLALAATARLQQSREFVWQKLGDCIRQEGDEYLIDRESLDDLMDRVPVEYAPVVGPCLFVQPADQRGEVWVVNRLLEGTGRYASRYTAVMEGDLRFRYTDLARRCSTFEAGGEPAELLDVLSARGNNLNVHTVQTPRVLELPGEASEVENTRRLRLRDLRVRLTGQDLLATLVDTEGRRVLPTHFGSVNLRLMPTLINFLAQFGPGDFGYPLPPLPAKPAGDLELHLRLRIGNVILKRKRWAFSAEPVVSMLKAATDSQVFERTNRWRHAHGIPDQVFISEKLPVKFFEREVFKPQYLSFGSPLFVSIFQSALRASTNELTIEEMLPTPDMFPVDGHGRGWAVELQLDSLFLNRCAFNERRHEPLVGDEAELIYNA